MYNIYIHIEGADEVRNVGQLLRGAVFALEDIQTQWKVLKQPRPSNTFILISQWDVQERSKLKKLCHWQAVPAELQRLQKYKDLLLDNTEKVLLSVHPVSDYLVISACCHGPKVIESSCRIVQLYIIIISPGLRIFLGLCLLFVQ